MRLKMLMTILSIRFVYISLKFIIEITCHFFQIIIFQMRFLNLVHSGFLIFLLQYKAKAFGGY